MAKASIKRPDGTDITIEGSAEEIKQVLEIYQGSPSRSPKKKPIKQKKNDRAASERDCVNHADILNIITSCDEAESIDDKVLNSRSQLNRIMLPLYIAFKYLDEDVRLSTGDIEKITSDLRTKVSKANSSTCLSKAGKSYVEIDKVRKKGVSVGYRINRRGIAYFEGVLAGSSGG